MQANESVDIGICAADPSGDGVDGVFSAVTIVKSGGADSGGPGCRTFDGSVDFGVERDVVYGWDACSCG